MDKHPSAMSYYEYAKECDTYEQPEKIMIVFPSNTVVEINAMMIESFRTTFTGIAMIARNVNCLLAFIAALELFFIIVFFYSQKKIIDRITYRYSKEIIYYCYKKCIDGCKHYP